MSMKCIQEEKTYDVKDTRRVLIIADETPADFPKTGAGVDCLADSALIGDGSVMVCLDESKKWVLMSGTWYEWDGSGEETAIDLTEYDITWLDWDDTELDTDTVYIGNVPVYGGETPTRAPDAQYTYTFDAWSPVPVEAEADATYKATYTRTVNKYDVTFVDDDETTVLKEATQYDYGTPASEIVQPETPTKQATAEYTYEFAGWSPSLADVTADATYKATYTATPVVP